MNKSYAAIMIEKEVVDRFKERAKSRHINQSALLEYLMNLEDKDIKASGGQPIVQNLI